MAPSSSRPLRALGLAAALAVAACADVRVAAVPEPDRIRPVVALEAPPPAEAARVSLPPGFRAEPVVTDLTYPSSVELDDQGGLYLAEAGFVYGDYHAVPRILRVAPDGALEVVADDSDGLVGPITDLLWHDGQLFVSHRGKVSALRPGGTLRHLVEGLPSNGGHYNNQLALGPDGKLYLGQGTYTNSGVVGVDDFLFLWLPQHPREHDRPARDIELRGDAFTTINPFALSGTRGDDEEDAPLVQTGAFAPFGEEVDDRVRGVTKANGTILRLNLDGSELEVFAWGLRNPFGVAFTPDGRLWAADNGYDERGSRRVANAPDVLWQVKEGAWYGWPDYVAGVPITDERFEPEGGPPLEFLMKEHPPVEQPVMTFPPHASPTKLAVCPGGPFGREGELFLALFGHLTPFTGKHDGAHFGHRVVRIDPETGRIEHFFGPRPEGAASKDARAKADPHDPGPWHPMDVVFTPDGRAAYVVDLGAMVMLHTAVPLPKPFPGTGVLWRIVPEGEEVDGPPAGLSPLPGKSRAGRPR